MSGASTVAHTSRDSPSVTALPPDQGVELANVESAKDEQAVKSAVRVARKRKAEGCFLLNSDIQWGQQMAVMFQIVSTMVLELPSFLGELEELRDPCRRMHN